MIKSKNTLFTVFHRIFLDFELLINLLNQNLMRTDCFDNKSVILMRNYFNCRVFFPKTIALLRNYDKLWYKLSTVV